MDNEDIVERIRKVRKDSGLSMEKFAKALGIQSSGNISAWESGRALPGALALKAMHEVFGYSVDWILTGEVLPKSEKLSPKHAELIRLFESVPEEAQPLLFTTIYTLIQNSYPGEKSNPNKALSTSRNTGDDEQAAARSDIA